MEGCIGIDNGCHHSASLGRKNTALLENKKVLKKLEKGRHNGMQVAGIGGGMTVEMLWRIYKFVGAVVMRQMVGGG